jgi:hypothetical protein
LATGRSTIASSGHTASLAVERLAYHALLAGLQTFLAEDYAGALTIAAAPVFIALLRPGKQAEDSGLQRLRQQAIQLLNQVRGELTLLDQRPAHTIRRGHDDARLDRIVVAMPPARPTAPPRCLVNQVGGRISEVRVHWSCQEHAETAAISATVGKSGAVCSLGNAPASQ